MSEYVCVLDLGTTGIKAGLLDETGRMASLVRAPASPVSRDASEFDANHTLEVVQQLIRDLVELRPGARIAAVSVASQRATTVPVSSEGRAVGPALSWQDTRAATAVAALSARLDPDRFETITGLPLSFLWTVSKLLWLRNERPTVWKSACRFVLLNDFVLRNLGTEDFVTDPSNASLTGLLSLDSLDWSDEVLDAAGLTRDRLPRLAPSGQPVGRVSRDASGRTGLAEGTLLVAGGGDQQCAALGQGVLDPGDASLCLGTAAVVSCPTDRPVTGNRGRFFCTVHAAPARWVMEGIHNAFGSSLKWALDLLGLSEEAELEGLARESESAGAVFVPHLAGVGSPDHVATARAALVGLGPAHGRAQVARAVYEGVALETRRILDAMEVRGPIRRLVLSGGPSATGFLPRILATLTARTLVVRACPESALAGAAALAWTGAGRYPDVFAAARAATTDGPAQELAPGHSEAVESRYARYLECVTTLLSAPWNREEAR